MSAETERKSEQTDPPRAVLRILSILQVLGLAEHPTTLAVIAREVDAPRSSVLNLLRALTQHGYVTTSGGRYDLGPNSFRLSASISAKRNFLSSAEHIMKRLAHTTGETVMVAILADNREELVYVAKEESRSALRVSAAVGDTRPLYASAGGLAMLAYMPSADVRICLAPDKLRRLTPLTEINPLEIEAKLEQVRRHGWVQLTGSVNLGASTVAAPVIGEGGILASIIVGIPTERFNAAPQDDLCAATVRAAHELSTILGGQPAPPSF